MRRILPVAILVLTLPGTLLASVIEFQLDKAIADAGVGGSGGGHVLWLPGITTVSGATDRWDLLSGGIFSWDQDEGTATMSGRVFNIGKPELLLDFAFDFAEVSGPPIVPKKELNASAYGASPLIDTATWTFFGFTGTLTGAGGGITGTFNITQLPLDGMHPFQLGFGANGKNTLFGASAWFRWDADTSTTIHGLTSTRSGKHGDVNINLQEIPVPAPPVVPLVLLGAGLLLVVRRKS